MMLNLNNKVVVITGGAGLLGSRFSEIILRNNGIPIILDNSKKNLKKLEKKLNHIKKKSLFFNIDVREKNQVEKVIKKIIKKFKKIDCLINNLAFNPQSKNLNSKLENISLDQWNSEISIGLTSSLVVTQAIVKFMIKKRYGSIINISSDLGIIAPNQSIYGKFKKPISYSVVKHGMVGFSHYLATYLADKNIRSNVLCPGGIKTNQDLKFRKKLEQLIPLKRMANIDDYDGIILYLCSDFSKYMTGSVISVDGGRTVW